jgi:hypothetical protein
VDPSWLRWDQGAVEGLARRIRDEGDLAALSVLADALEDAGCTDEAILAHYREAGPHAQGCWVLDVCRLTT